MTPESTHRTGVSPDNKPESDAVPILRTRVRPQTFIGVQDKIHSMVERNEGGYVSCANVYSVTMAYEDPEYQEILNRAQLITTDGMPIVWALKLLGYRSERVHNDDLFLACCARFPKWRVFLVGGRVGQPEKVAEEVRKRYPGINIVGTHPTPIRPVPEEENARILEKINATKPSIIWAALGTPAQDYWMHAMAERVGVPMVGCGSLFDLLVGHTRPAPEWMKRNGLQWFFRLCQEPRRLAWRYTYYNTRFILAFTAQFLSTTARRVKQAT